jgi:hypothetical protein
MRGSLLIFVMAANCAAHSISVSQSEGTIDGNTLDLTVRMPRYEAEHFAAGGNGAARLSEVMEFQGARLGNANCQDAGEDLVCRMSYSFAGKAPDELIAQVRLARITVPNHVHIMRLAKSGIQRQGVFDRTFEREEFLFGQTRYWDGWWRGARMGFSQLLYQPLVLALVFAVGAFSVPAAYVALAGAAFFLVLPDKFYAPPAFFELAAAMSLVYLSLEGLFFAGARGRWAVAAALGLLEGAALAVLARPAGMDAIAVGTGNLGAQVIVCLAASRLARNMPPRLTRSFEWALLAIGLAALLWIAAKRL